MKALVRKKTIEYLEVEVPVGSSEDDILEAAYKADPRDWDVDEMYYSYVVVDKK
jgi:hypothetical protein